MVLETSDADDEKELQRRRCVSCGFSEDYIPSENRYDSLPKGKREKINPANSTSDVVRIIDPVLIRK
jgi:Zn ribbon nucleic-acid-binding protein